MENCNPVLWNLAAFPIIEKQALEPKCQLEKQKWSQIDPSLFPKEFDGNTCVFPGSDHPAHELPNCTWEAEAESVKVVFSTLLFSTCT